MSMETFNTLVRLIGIGIALIIIGFLAVDYFLLKRGVDFAGRAKYFFFGLLFIIASVAIGYWFYSETSDLLEITSNGKEAVGEVRDSKTETRFRSKGRRRIIHKNTVSYNGHEKTFNLDKAYPAGTKFYVVYSQKDPGIARISKLRQGFFDYFLSQHAWWEIVIFIIGPIVAGLLGVWYLYTAFSSKRIFESIEE